MRLLNEEGVHTEIFQTAYGEVLTAFSAFSGGLRIEGDEHWIACANGQLIVSPGLARNATSGS